MRTLHLLGVVFGIAACDSKLTDQQPIGSQTDSDAAIEHFLRRATLDLSGHVPDTDQTATVADLRAAGNTAAARSKVIDDLMANDEFAQVWITELETAIFGGNDLAQQYTEVCALTVGVAVDCQSCTNPDPCLCDCPEATPLAAERADLETTVTDLRAAKSTGSIERRYASASGYFVLAGTPEARVSRLFTDFLARTAEADEIENGRAMIFGSLLPGSPAGVMFHRDGASYADLVDIVFSDEVYREAVVRRVFERYLARDPSAAELSHFVALQDATDPDARDIVRAVLSSREYFDQ